MTVSHTTPKTREARDIMADARDAIYRGDKSELQRLADEADGIRAGALAGLLEVVIYAADLPKRDAA